VVDEVTDIQVPAAPPATASGSGGV
jgi:hypothetical protein